MPHAASAERVHSRGAGSQVTAGGFVTLRECVTIADPNCRPTYLPIRCHPEAAAR